VDGVKHYPFGKGSGEMIQKEFGVPHLIQMPMTPDLSAAGDGGVPLVMSNPTGDVASRYQVRPLEPSHSSPAARVKANTHLKGTRDLRNPGFV
jgi:hypothetical protein